jgi:porin
MMAALGIALAVLALGILGGRAEAQTADSTAPSGAPQAPETLTGEWGGLRTRMRNAGFRIDVTYIGEVLGNLSGGTRRGAIYEGRLEMAFQVDLARAIGWSGATFRASAYQIHGRGLSANNLGNNLLVASGIEAVAATRLHDLSLTQELLGGALQIRAGQFAADDGFAVSAGAANFINSTFGWPGLFATDLPSGGPAYPLATPGIQIQARPSDQFTFAAAVFNGDPVGPGPGNPQDRDRSSTQFRVNDDAFLIAEITYLRNLEPEARGLPGTYKLGMWYHSGRFADQRFDSAGRSLADPASSGVAGQHRGNFAVYVTMDQMLWRPQIGGDQGIGAFLRIAGSPGDRNLVNFYIDGGVTWKGLIPGRDDDVLALGVGYARISRAARGLDRDTAAFTGQESPVRNYEAVLELTYIAQVTPWLTVQPDFQLIIHPGANAAITGADGRPTTIANAAILGLRSTVRF